MFAERKLTEVDTDVVFSRCRTLNESADKAQEVCLHLLKELKGIASNDNSHSAAPSFCPREREREGALNAIGTPSERQRVWNCVARHVSAAATVVG